MTKDDFSTLDLNLTPDTPGDAAATEDEAPPEVGARLGSFELLEKLGSGGMGTVYLAWDQALNRRVALKVLHARRVGAEEALKRLRKEAALPAQLKHDGIVEVYHIDQDARPPYFVMEFVPGQSVQKKVAHEGRMRPMQAADVVIQICSALEHAHENNIIHRDIKPSNLLLDSRTDRARITDFGIAQDLTHQVGDTTVCDGSSVGTPLFMSPEQHRGEALDERTDIFSLGLTLYYMLTAKLAYSARTREEFAQALDGPPPKRPSELSRRVGDEMDRIVMKMIAVDREQRYSSCADVERDLRALLDFCRQRRRLRRVRLSAVVALLVAGVFLTMVIVQPWRAWPDPSAGTAPDALASVVADADRAFRSGRMDEALGLYTSVANSDRAGPRAKAAALAGLGRIASAEGDKGKAEGLYRLALRQEPGNLRAEAGLAALLIEAGRHAEALALLGSKPVDPLLARLADWARRAEQRDARIAESDYIRRTVDDLVRLHRQRQQAPNAAAADDWTSRPVAVCFHRASSTGSPAFHEGADGLLVDEITKGLLQRGRFGVVERKELERILEELRVSASELADPDLSLRLGRLHPARGEVFVAVDRADGATTVSLRLIDTETSVILGMPSARAGGAVGPEVVDKLVQELHGLLEAAFPVRGRVLRRTEQTVELNIGARVGLKSGTRLSVLSDAEPPAEIAELVVESVTPDRATARIVGAAEGIGEHRRVRAQD